MFELRCMDVGFDCPGVVTGANRQAARLLCMPRAALPGMAFGALFDRRLQGLFAQPARRGGDLVEMQTHVGLQVMARFEGEAAREGARQLLGPSQGPGMPAAGPGDAPPASVSLRMLECQAIERTLAALGGNVSATAKALGISRNTIYRRRQALGDSAD
jgi:hypothetical protein